MHKCCNQAIPHVADDCEADAEAMFDFSKHNRRPLNNLRQIADKLMASGIVLSALHMPHPTKEFRAVSSIGYLRIFLFTDQPLRCTKVRSALALCLCQDRLRAWSF
jgi:hypothetical protein